MTATDDGTLLLRAILDNPAEDTPRLVFADWLEENGQGERAEFIRVQCEIARLEGWTGGCDPVGEDACITDESYRLRNHAKAMLECHSHEWFALPPVHVPEPAYFAQWWGDVQRGFRHRLTCTAEAWLRVADAITEAHPVERVRLTTWPSIRVESRPAQSSDLVGLEDDPRQTMYDATDIARQAGEAQGDRNWLRLMLNRRWPRVTFELPAE